MLRYLDDDTALLRYLELRAEMKLMEAEIKDLQPMLLAALMEEPDADQGMEFGGYRLEVGTRRSWQYSGAVVQMQNELRAIKKLEEANRAGQTHYKLGIPKSCSR